MKNHFYNNLKIGVLGGGQLGRMFIQEAVNFDATVYIMDPDPEAPCKNIANSFIQGDLKDFDAVYNFGKSVDLLTIEIEHVNVDAMQRLEDEGLKVYPRPALLKIVQDKGLQKQFYFEHQIPTADFYLVKDKSEIAQYKAQFPFMQKLRKGGYDGRGVTRLENPDNLESAFDEPSVLEKLIDFEKEISVIIARNAEGVSNCFPVVELEFNPEANLVEFLFAPANISKDIEAQAFDIASKVAGALDLVGILAVEMFVTKDGKVLVNEIAPRTHNSGHHTIEANYTSQYEQHLRSILNLPLGSTKAKCPAVMVNLLGEKGYTGNVNYKGLEEVLSMEGVKLHLYGKKTTKPFRKMGHITVLAEDLTKAKEKAKKVKELLKVIGEE
jgi:5-(carboxyamino)imidazole ribonucleotide synthase